MLPCSGLQKLGVVLDVLGHKGGYIEVAVVIAIALLEYGLDVIVGGGCRQEVLGEQLFACKEVVSGALIDEKLLGSACIIGDQAGGIPMLPVVLIGSQVAGKGLLTPRALRWIGYGCKCRNRLIETRVL